MKVKGINDLQKRERLRNIVLIGELLIIIPFIIVLILLTIVAFFSIIAAKAKHTYISDIGIVILIIIMTVEVITFILLLQKIYLMFKAYRNKDKI